MPVADRSVDVVISNCVINLSPNKSQVWQEIARVLKPGGRACISDLALLKPLPEAVRESVEALVGCVAGAALVDDIREMVNSAGLALLEFTTSANYMDQMSEWSDPLYRDIASKLPAGTKASDFVANLSMVARKVSIHPRCAASHGFSY